MLPLSYDTKRQLRLTKPDFYYSLLHFTYSNPAKGWHFDNVLYGMYRRNEFVERTDRATPDHAVVPHHSKLFARRVLAAKRDCSRDTTHLHASSSWQ